MSPGPNPTAIGRPAYGWTDWAELPLRPPAGPEVLAEILDGGQTFRWERQRDLGVGVGVGNGNGDGDGNGGGGGRDDRAGEAVRDSGAGAVRKRDPAPMGRADAWTGSWGGHRARLRSSSGGGLLWSVPSCEADTGRAALLRLLAAETDFPSLADALPWRSDPHLARCLAAYPGLRLLRQPFGETLLCFLCSAAKRIPQIKAMAALLAGRLGQAGALPTWERLSRCSEADLRGCSLGFRARHVRAAALAIAARPGWLEETEALPYARAHARLLELPGVGAKVADCVLLFGAGQLEAFPVDVWILRAMARRYGLEGWSPAQVSHFGRVHFGPAAGLAQQYLFAWERHHGHRDP